MNDKKIKNWKECGKQKLHVLDANIPRLAWGNKRKTIRSAENILKKN
jgi:hypothetical protein